MGLRSNGIAAMAPSGGRIARSIAGLSETLRAETLDFLGLPLGRLLSDVVVDQLLEDRKR